MKDKLISAVLFRALMSTVLIIINLLAPEFYI